MRNKNQWRLKWKKKFMKEALKEAKKAYDKLEVPVGCVIVKWKNNLKGCIT